MRHRLMVLLLLLVFTACGGTKSAALGPTASVTEPETTTTTLSPVQHEVEAAYLHSWDVYTDAMSRLDTSRLGDVYADEALRLRTEEVNDLKASGRAAAMAVEHHIGTLSVDGDDAVLLDDYLNHSVAVDPTTRRALEADPNEVLHRTYTFRREAGTWHVVSVKAR